MSAFVVHDQDTLNTCDMHISTLLNDGGKFKGRCSPQVRTAKQLSRNESVLDTYTHGRAKKGEGERAALRTKFPEGDWKGTTGGYKGNVHPNNHARHGCSNPSTLKKAENEREGGE